MLLALVLIIAIVAVGMYDQVKLILVIFAEEKTVFSVFIAVMLYCQLSIASAVISISEGHLFVAFDPKNILIDMFSLLLINNIDEYVGALYLKYEVSGCEEGHGIISKDDWLKFDFSVF